MWHTLTPVAPTFTPQLPHAFALLDPIRQVLNDVLYGLACAPPKQSKSRVKQHRISASEMRRNCAKPGLNRRHYFDSKITSKPVLSTAILDAANMTLPRL